MAKGKKNNRSTEVVDAKKIKTGETTDLGFIRALKAKGVTAKAEFPAETLRAQLDGLSEEVKVSFDSTNETVLSVVNGETPVPPAVIDFKSAVRMDVSGALPGDNPGIVENGDKYTVAKNGNTITVTDDGLIPYIGGDIDEPKKWVGILVDLGVRVQGTRYYILPEDYSDAARWGAQNDTTFIMWLTTEQGDTFTFKNVENEEDTIDITVTFVE